MKIILFQVSLSTVTVIYRKIKPWKCVPFLYLDGEITKKFLLFWLLYRASSYIHFLCEDIKLKTFLNCVIFIQNTAMMDTAQLSGLQHCVIPLSNDYINLKTNLELMLW